ncbi:anhydro-N-acetylmuramic acid kinase [Pseudahrensia aquimaris]|uniref:Anhydro-N-acetylmuramic acid kinase n=1 Tax=Pseudahrensia aquimaris TaxID=744461 RepID=A0ABW3FAN9_9HYPH
MSGTSMDGIDVAMLSSDGEGWIEFGPSISCGYSPSDRTLLERALVDAAQIRIRTERLGALGDAEAMIIQRHVEAVGQFLKVNNLRPSDIDLIGFHGQTVLHRPDERLTVQIGDGHMLARELGIDTVFDMRAADIAAGGQGAPLVPVFHEALATRLHIEGPICFVNIGGISNITYLREGDPPVAFDTGPGNALIDQWMQTVGGIPYDAAGAIASEGQVVGTVVERYMATPYFQKTLPKSLDRLDFPALDPSEADLSDGARSLARLTAEAIFAGLDHLPEPPKNWIVCGGGRHNRAIMSDLRELAGEYSASVHSAEDVNLDGDMMEAQAFAYLAIRARADLPLTFPTTTGCPQPMSGGVFAPAKEAKDA